MDLIQPIPKNFSKISQQVLSSGQFGVLERKIETHMSPVHWIFQDVDVRCREWGHATAQQDQAWTKILKIIFCNVRCIWGWQPENSQDLVRVGVWFFRCFQTCFHDFDMSYLLVSLFRTSEQPLRHRTISDKDLGYASRLPRQDSISNVAWMQIEIQLNWWIMKHLSVPQFEVGETNEVWLYLLCCI